MGLETHWPKEIKYLFLRKGQSMNKDQRTIYKKIENPDRNCMVSIFPLKEYWHSPTMNWACEGPSVEGQITSVAYVYIVSKVRQRMITLSLFHIGIHLLLHLHFYQPDEFLWKLPRMELWLWTLITTSYGLINKNREKPRLGKIIFKEIYFWIWEFCIYENEAIKI